MMEGFSFLGDKHDIITSCGANICNGIIESSSVEIACYGRFGMLPREYNSETIMTDFIWEYIGDESIRKKRFAKSQNLFYFVFTESINSLESYGNNIIPSTIQLLLRQP